MSTKRKKIAAILAAAVVFITLISLCLVGSTMALYTSGSTSTATVNVADWDVTLGSDGSGHSATTTFTVTSLSPSATLVTSDSTETNNATAKTLVAIVNIKNTTDVAATIKLTAESDIKLNSNVSYGSSFTVSGGSVTDNPNSSEVSKLFSVKLYTTKSYVDASTTLDSISTDASALMDTGSTVSAGTVFTVYVYAQIVWNTTYIDGSTENYLDTWVAQNVEKIEVTINLTATQGSEVNS